MKTSESDIRLESIRTVRHDVFNQKNVCIVTGAGTGIGRAISVAAAVNKLMVVGLDDDERSGKQTQNIAREMGGQMIFIKTDLMHDSDMEFAVKEATKMGKIRFLANTAWAQFYDRIESFPVNQFDRMQNLMVRAPFILTKLVIPHMKITGESGGVIGNLVSVDSHTKKNGDSVFCMTQNALKVLTDKTVKEGKGRIRSFSIDVRIEKHDSETIAYYVKKNSKYARFVEVQPIEIANNFVHGFAGTDLKASSLAT